MTEIWAKGYDPTNRIMSPKLMDGIVSSLQRLRRLRITAVMRLYDKRFLYHFVLPSHRDLYEMLSALIL